ncbi:DUF4279 domain-containing protein [Luteolibacter sp. AS25]|uniref:DUF4279 domain-containing protein n=1 Tax=Luteolibacter sp. AS25 TaxID=3135776 RepID=UPI00398B7F27
MACLHQSAIALRIVGDDLVPSDITDLLGATPDYSCAKGDTVVSKKTGKTRTLKSGMWQLKTQDCQPENINGQIREILERLTDDMAIWESLASQYHVDLFCGLFMNCSNEGLDFTAGSLSALGERGIKIALNIYAPSQDEQNTKKANKAEEPTPNPPSD